MSKLTDCQIMAIVRGMEQSLAGAVSRGDWTAARRAQKKIDGYRAELRDRAAGLAVQEPQADRRSS